MRAPEGDDVWVLAFATPESETEATAAVARANGNARKRVGSSSR